jgi:hypothetical protein
MQACSAFLVLPAMLVAYFFDVPAYPSIIRREMKLFSLTVVGDGVSVWLVVFSLSKPVCQLVIPFCTGC